ncbi:D-alanine--D-alanine ligase [Candidatus Microgenomates bacterium]|nr:D-alanine--D-alanine ligase [Candidatus Microgenomates bacterium]
MAKRYPFNIAILSGGPSAEHEISLLSAREVVKNLDPQKYNALPIIISKDGKTWLPVSKEKFLESKNGQKSIVVNKTPTNTNVHALKALTDQNGEIDICFISLHGPFGEDGTIQSILEFLGIPYTGSGPLASALGMDKIQSMRLFSQAGLNTPKNVILNKNENPSYIWKELSLPVVVKPNNQGSSLGISIVHKKNGLLDAIRKARKFSRTIIVEEYIKGTEITCGVIGNDNPKPLPLVEIVPKNEFFDYQAKYTPGATDEIAPARISKELTKKAQETALKAYRTLGCRGFGRVDMIIKRKRIYILEVNTIPGLTPISLLPKAAQAAGILFPRLLDKIIKLALSKDKLS